MLFRFALVVSFYVIVVPSAARADDGQMWIGATASGAIVGPMRLSIETIARFGEGTGGGLYESENIAMLGYRTGDVTFAAGYVRDIVYRGGGAAIEQRARQDLTAERLAAVGPVRISGRLRIEERWHDAQAGTGVRVRPFLRATLPVRNGFQAVASYEGFINLGTGAGQRAGYDRTRLFLGLSVPVTRKIGAELGYMRQTTRGAGVTGAATLGLTYRW